MATFTLTGTGTQAISSPGSLAITITVSLSLPQKGQANPANWYHLGLLRLGTAHGYLPAVPLDATNMLLPCPNGATILGYKLETGVTITAEERAEQPYAGPTGPPGADGATGPTGASGSTVISDQTLTGSAANIDFSSIPNTYTSLVLEFLLRGDQVANSNSIFVTFNNDTGANYTGANMNTAGASVAAGGAVAAVHFTTGTENASSSNANRFATGRLWVPFYQSGQHKNLEWQTYQAPNSGATTEGVVWRGGATWLSTAVITRLTLAPQSGNFITASRARLIGIL